MFRTLVIVALCALGLLFVAGDVGGYLQKAIRLLSHTVEALNSASPANAQSHTNSCSNVDVLGTYDESGLRESSYGISAVGTFRILGEENEAKQPMFNLAMVNCEHAEAEMGGALQCKVTEAVVSAQSGNPDTDKPNCSLDLDISSYSMKELGNGVLTGMQANSSACYNSILTIDQNTKRVYMSFTKTALADKAKKLTGLCGRVLPTEVLMNCTGWARLRKGGQTPARYCDFSSSEDKITATKHDRP